MAQCSEVGGSGGSAGRNPYDGISPLVRRADRGSQPCVNTKGRPREHRREAAICKAGSGPAAGTEPPPTLTLDLAVPTIVRNECLLSKPLGPWQFGTAA